MAPPLPPVMSLPVASPSANVRFCTVSAGVGWSWQCEVVQSWAWSQVFWYRIRTRPPPLRVTLPPPSRTTCWLVFTTLAVCVMVIVTGAGPQLKVMMPPAATAATTACEVQLAGVPVPMTRLGCAVLTGWAAAGTGAFPAGLPGAGPVAVVGTAPAGVAGLAGADERGRGGGEVVAAAGAIDAAGAVAAAAVLAPAAAAPGGAAEPQAARPAQIM